MKFLRLMKLQLKQQPKSELQRVAATFIHWDSLVCNKTCKIDKSTPFYVYCD